MFFWSLIVTFKGKFPKVVGLPLMVEPFAEAQAGRFWKDQRSIPMPPLAASVKENGVFNLILGMEELSSKTAFTFKEKLASIWIIKECI